jgi:hypothetical protein
MALLQEKTLYNGDVTRYHRITSYELDTTSAFAKAVLSSYRNLQHRAMPATPVTTMEFSFAWSGSADTLGQEAYDYIKSLPEWAGAEDA